jgi:hypothetical protein
MNRHAPLLLSALVVASANVHAQQESSPANAERLFVEGTALFQASGSNRDPARGLEKLRAAAELKYEHAPFGLCVALSAEPRIVNLVESYAWCEVAATIPNRNAVQAKERALQVLGRISVEQGAASVAEAKSRADRFLGK